MSARKSLIAAVILLSNGILVPNCYADITLADAVQQMITYLTSAATIANQATAELMFMSPPGTNEAAQNVGISAGAVEATLGDKLSPKELADINWGLYATPRSGETINGSATNNFIENHKSYFCSPDSGVENVLDEQACQANAGSIANQHGDLKISTLLEPSIYDNRQQILAEEVIRTLTAPFPNSKIKDMVSAGLDKATDKTYVAKVMAKHAGIAAARNSLNEIFGARLPEVAPLNPPRAVSIMSIMEDESGRRFKNRDWYDSVQQASHEALLRELVHMEAYRLWLDYYRYRQNERVEALLAVMTAQNADLALQYLDTMPQQ